MANLIVQGAAKIICRVHKSWPQKGLVSVGFQPSKNICLDDRFSKKKVHRVKKKITKKNPIKKLKVVRKSR